MAVITSNDKKHSQSGMKVDEVPFPRMKLSKLIELAKTVKTEFRETHPVDYPVNSMI